MKTLKTITRAAFDKLPNPTKRVLIAQDVIAQLDAKKFVSNRGNYFEFKVPKKKQEEYGVGESERYEPLADYYAEYKTDTAQKLIKDSTCYVCAKGAAICSFVQKFNNKSIQDLDENDDDLVKIFGDELWEAIEHHFEGWSGNASKSLRWLMNNIIENNGFLKIKGVLIGE